MEKVIGIVNLHSNVEYQGLTTDRPVASVSFLGRYGIIDFVLSNLSNSGIDAVGVLIQEKPRSLFKHLGNGDSWNFNSKAGGVSLLYNEKFSHQKMYNHDINNLIENIAFLKSQDADYVVIAPAHIVTTLDYSKVIDEHIKSNADVTMVYKHIDNNDMSYLGNQVMTVKKNRVTNLEVYKGERSAYDISLDTYVFNVETLLELLEDSKTISSFFSIKDMLSYKLDEKLITGYEYTGYAACISSFNAYYKYSLDLLNTDVYEQLFRTGWPIYTNTNDTPPTKYFKAAVTRKSFVANGAIIKGTVENSILGRNVEIGKNAIVKNCIIFSGSKIAPNAVLENVIIDKNAQIKRKIEVRGQADSPAYIKEGDIV